MNKTEVICFSCQDITAVPTSFQLSGNTIQLTDSGKVLGITIDRRLNFKQHSQNVLNNLIYRWVCISRYTNRNWGLNQKVLMRLTKTLMFSCLFYGSLIWHNNTNLVQLNKFWYKLANYCCTTCYSRGNSWSSSISCKRANTCCKALPQSIV